MTSSIFYTNNIRSKHTSYLTHKKLFTAKKKEEEEDRHFTYNVPSGAFVQPLLLWKKAISITYSECAFEARGIQHAMRMSHTVICGLPGSKIYFSKFSHKRHDF